MMPAPQTFFLTSCLYMLFATTIDAQAAPDITGLLDSLMNKLAGYDQSFTLIVEETSRRDSISIRKLRIQSRNGRESESLFRMTFIEVVSAGRGAGQKYWRHQFRDGTQRQWIYLPGSRKIKQISRNPARRKTKFDISDLELTPENLARHQFEMVQDTSINGQQLIVIRTTETAAEDAKRKSRRKRTGSKMIWVDRDALLIVRAEIYSGKGRLERIITLDQTQIVDGLELAQMLTVIDARKGKKSVIRLEGLSLAPITDEKIFHPDQ